MANIYKNTGRRGAVSPGGKVPVKLETEQDPVAPVRVENNVPAEMDPNVSGAAVLANIRKTQKTKKKNASFYLSTANIDRLFAMAEQENMSASELLDYILKNVFEN